MQRRCHLSRASATALLCAILSLLTASGALARPSPRAQRARRGGFDLRAASTWSMGVNRVRCQLRNDGQLCSSMISVELGAYWPAGTPNAYIFNSGVQIAGIIPDDAGIWAGDTVGAYFMDATGITLEGESVTSIYSSLNPDDVGDWPDGAIVRDAAIYHPSLLGRKSIAEEDNWVRYYDGPGFLSGRRHPMGILVEQRGLGWNYPAGNEDIIYWVFTLYNITASDPAVYAGRDQGIVNAAQHWVEATERKLAVDLPSGGYRIDSIYAAITIDPDVGLYAKNASTPILPFDLGVAYNTTFDDVGFVYQPEVSQPPFGPYMGLVGIKYLKSPLDPATGEEVGLTMFSNTEQSVTSPFHDPRGVAQLWRYLSGNLRPDLGDMNCNIADAKQRRLCGLMQAPTDTRFYQASGPFSLAPGESISIVVAYLFASSVADAVIPYFQGYMAPGIPASGAELAADPSLVRDIERAAGWLDATDRSGDGVIQQEEVTAVPYSLLDKALVAQSLFDTKFLMPFAPEVPEFFLVPGDDQVTVVWQPSATETVGDPFYQVASDPLGGLSDPNYRDNDVEGYRIYRGRNRATMELVAQFDYAGTTFVDYTGRWAYVGNCAPELGILDDCPDLPAAHDLVGDISQVQPGGRTFGGAVVGIVGEAVGTGNGTASPALTALAHRPVVPGSVTLTAPSASGTLVATDDGQQGWTGDAVGGAIDYLSGTITITWAAPVTASQAISADYRHTNPGGGGSVVIIESVNPVEDAGFPALSNTGVPFAYIDSDVRNSVSYFYAVTAFDVNSIASGPGTLESARITQSVTPRAAAANVTAATIEAGLYGRRQLLDQAAVFSFNKSSGTFTGSPPPTGLLSAAYELFVEAALEPTVIELRIDSVLPSYYEGAYYLTLSVDGQTSSLDYVGAPISESDEGSWGNFGPIAVPLPADSVAAAGQGQAGLPFAGQGNFDFTVKAVTWYSGDAEWHEQVDGGFWPFEGQSGIGGSRWFSGADETMADPTLNLGRGELTGVDAIYSPQPYLNVADNYFRRLRQCTWHAARQADVKFYWSSTPGTLDSVIDVTHNVPVPFNAGVYQAGWGFRDDIAGQSGAYSPPDGILTEYDFAFGPCFDGGLPNFSVGACETRPLLQQAVLQDVSIDGDGVADGTGFGLYFDHEFYIFQTEALPSNTVWTHRSYFGNIQGGQGAYTFTPKPANPAVPGLVARIEVVAPAAVHEVAAAELDNVHTVPDPYYVTSELEITPAQKILKFVNLPERAMIRIYSLSGILVDIIEHNDPQLGGEATWDVRNCNNMLVASGVYFYHVETPSGANKIGRFTVVNSGNIVVLENR
jgi:hypothetical protein